jgi:hypothetical protein
MTSNKTNDKLLSIINKSLDIDVNLPDNQFDKVKSFILTQIIATKMYAQRVIDIYNNARSDLWKLERQDRKYKDQGVTLTLLAKDIERQHNYVDNCHNQILNLGHILASNLDFWQNAGATYDDLFNLCCCSQKTINRIDKEDFKQPFSKLVWIYNLDFDKHTIDWLDMEYPAPITHAIKEYMFDQMMKAIKDPEIKKQMNDKLFELFPAIKDSALTMIKDEEGNTVMVNKDDEVVGIVEEAEPLNDIVKEGIINIFKIVYIDDNQDHDFYNQLKNGCNNFLDLLCERGFDTDSITNYLEASDENSIGELLDIIFPKVMSQKELLKVFEDAMK